MGRQTKATNVASPADTPPQPTKVAVAAGKASAPSKTAGKKSRQRRVKGEGTIFYRADRERYAVQVTLMDGRRITRYCPKGAGQADAVALKTKLLRDHDLGLPAPTDERTRLSVFLSSWLDRAAMKVRPTTHKRYRELLTLHALPSLGTVALAKLTPTQLEALYAAKIVEGLSAATVRQLHVILHHALRDALRKGLVARNVAEMVSPPRVVRHEIRPYSAEEVARMLAAAEGDDLEALYVLALATGARLGELLALHWDDVRLEGPQPAMQVRGTLVCLPKRDPYIAEPKTERSRRTVPLPAWALQALRDQRHRQREARLQAGELWHDRDLVFADALGDYLSGTHITRYALPRLLAHAGLRRIRFHDLRHTAATLALTGGTDIKRIADLLGHSTIAVTGNFYLHTSYDTLADATSAIERQIQRAQA